MNKNKFYGIQKIVVNGVRIYTLNISIKPSGMILNKIIQDPIWKDRHTLSVKNGVSVVNFTETIAIKKKEDQEEFDYSVRKLRDILFAHKVNKLMNDNPWTINKEGIIKDVLNQIQEENENFIL
jgi:hypothetical protein